MSVTSEASVATAKPAAYMKQLCKHFGHKVGAEWDDERGSIAFPFGVCELQAEESRLVLRGRAEDDESAARLEHVIGSHLERFGRRDELRVSWAPRG